MTIALQLILGLGVLNVWLLRARQSTPYRGSDAQDLKGEFLAYGLPAPVFWAVGAIKIGAALALIAGIWIPELVLPAAGVLAFLMAMAIAVHFKVRDALIKSVPAIMMLAMSAGLTYLTLGGQG